MKYASLGQDKNYYETLAALPDEFSHLILRNLRDCVFDLAIYESFRSEKGFQSSLLRTIMESEVTLTFPAALGGQALLTPFRFAYEFPRESSEIASKKISFAVDPNSLPPTNVHAIIGRNSAGKTRLLSAIAALLCRQKLALPDPTLGGIEFTIDDGKSTTGERFANLVVVTFSAFDPFRAPAQDAIASGDIRYAYVGLKKTQNPLNLQSDLATIETKSHDELSKEFAASLLSCRSGPRRRRWIEAVRVLETDPGFEELELRTQFELGTNEALAAICNQFQSLSSGHKIVLLTITRLVELVEERTLLLIDEPEAHLHPPLLSSLVRVLSTLLTRRNGAAILATHSPVVLQELPKNCVWVLNRSGQSTEVSRPQIQTFGENVGVLTREVFGLEVMESGFHQLIKEAVTPFISDYKDVLSKFQDQLGSEARAIVRTLVPPKE